MAFMKYAYARVVQPNVTKTEWKNVRVAAKKKVAESQGELSENLIQRASEFLGADFNPNKYLLTHATIIASVDTFSPPGMKTGSVTVDGFKVNRKYSNFRIKAKSDQYINNNMDAWDRPVLLKAYRTFIGGHNFVEHVQVEELSKGRIIDAVARDIGDSIYVDILIATDRKHKDLVKAIESGKMGTLSMGCFLPGTQVSLGDGRRIAIEDVQPGDMVLTHKGRAREVVNKQIRVGVWGIRNIKAVGVPDTIEATDNHPFFVFRQPTSCGCGCGEALPEYRGGRKNATRGLKRRFLRGHDKRILNPNNTYSMKEYQERKARVDAIQSGEGQWVRADDLRVGDFLCFPRVQAEGDVEVSHGKARLLGYFLAEGSFQKYKGELAAVEFSFSLGEKSTFVSEVVGLLKQEFPGKEPNVYEHEHRNGCSVRLGDRGAAQWFHQHGGEYSNHKALSIEVLAWSKEAHKHLIGTWINGDGHLHGIHEHTSGTTTSYDLACQMHMLMARCGWFARIEAKIGARCVEVREIVNGGFVRDEATGRLPHFNLIVGKTQAVSMAPYTAKAPCDAAFDSQGSRVLDDMVMFPITSIEGTTYEGCVHNMEVDEDNSYVVSGTCSHNCTVDGTICTKCGNWAADETEMCGHIKYAKGNSFFDEEGKQNRIAELCGHESIGDTGGVQFIEASWVETPAFTGAVLRNVLDFDAETVKKAKKVLASPPKEWAADSMQKAASADFDVLPKKFVTPVINRVLVEASADDMFLAGWMDEGGEGGEEAPAEAPAAPAAPAAPPKAPFQDVEDEAYNQIKDRIRDRFKKDLSPSAPTTPVSTNETLNKQASFARKAYVAGLNDIVRNASSDASLIDRVAAFNRQVGITIPVDLYRASLKVGSTDRYSSVELFTRACRQVLGRKPNPSETRTLVRLGQLLSRRKSSGSR